MIWLWRRLRPNFKTIADFRRENREAFRQVFRDFVKVCRSLELFGRELIAVDGTRIKAVNSRDRNFTGAKLRRGIAQSREREVDRGPGGIDGLVEIAPAALDTNAGLIDTPGLVGWLEMTAQPLF